LNTTLYPGENTGAFKTLIKNKLESLKSHTNNNQPQSSVETVKIVLSKVAGLASKVKSLEARAVDVPQPSGG